MAPGLDWEVGVPSNTCRLIQLKKMNKGKLRFRVEAKKKQRREEYGTAKQMGKEDVVEDSMPVHT